jgi:hypothetical protein
MENELSKMVQRAEWIGVVSSPSTSHSLKVDLIAEAGEKNLVGNFCICEFRQEGRPIYVMGQILSASLENPYVERHAVRKITSIRGHAPPLTEQHDVRGIDVMLGSAYTLRDVDILPETVGTVPSTGTKVFLLNQEIVDGITGHQLPLNISYIGRLYNTNILLPMFFIQFGKEGLGEGYHIGIFGKTGSGKSYLARMIIAAYSKFPEMSVLVLDPVGEYSKEVRNRGPMVIIHEKSGKTVEVVGIADITFSDPSTLLRILLRTQFLHELGVIAEENQQNTLYLIKNFLTQPPKPPLLYGVSILSGVAQIDTWPAFQQLLSYLQKNVNRIYVSDEPQQRVLDRILSNAQTLFQQWAPVASLFVHKQNKIRIEDLLQKICQDRKTLVIDLSGIAPSTSIQDTEAASFSASFSTFWTPEVGAILLNEIFTKLRGTAERLYHQGRLLNVLVVLDEAHRFIPSEKPLDEDIRTLKSTLTIAAQETRKFGLGWMFISTSIAGLEMQVLKQMRVCFFGYGLSWGGELRALRDLIGEGEYLNLYQSFRDPTTLLTMGGKQYPFMVYGPISPLSVSGNPLFFNALDYTTEFLNVHQQRHTRTKSY